MADPVWLKEVKCPACDAVFKAARVKSSALKVTTIDTDFHKTYENLRPLLYAVTVCPECNFSARNDEFEKAQLGYQKEVMALSKAIKTSGKNVKFPEDIKTDTEEAVKKHLLAVAFAKHYKPENPNTISGLYMHIVWLYREEGNHEKEMEYMGKALEYYIKTFEKGNFVPEKIGVVGIMYLIGEMYRTLGNYNDAILWFARALKNKEIEAYPNIEHLTRDALEKITEEKKKNNNS